MLRISATMFAVRRVPPVCRPPDSDFLRKRRGGKAGPAAARGAAVYHAGRTAETERL
jgi:hypothetical protein